LGEGAYGRVYRTQRKSVKYAVKYFDEDYRAFWLQERAMIRAAQGHPNILNFFEAGREGYSFVLLLELGTQDLHRAYPNQNRRPDFSQMNEIALQVASATAFLHSREIVHCDLRKRNIILMASGNVKITDFGIARFFSNLNINFFVYPAIKRAPEVVTKKHFDEKIDMWGFGCLLNDLLQQYTFLAERGSPLPKDFSQELVDLLTPIHKTMMAYDFTSDLQQAYPTEDITALAQILSGCLAPQDVRFSAAKVVSLLEKQLPKI